MIESNSRPVCVGEVAIVTKGCCLNMVGWFSGCCRAIMAAVTRAGYCTMVKIDAIPIGSRGMTAVAFSGSCNMAGEFSSSVDAVMTADTLPSKIAMIDTDKRPTAGGFMAAIALGRGIQVVTRFSCRT